MPNIMNFAMNVISQNPQIANNPNAQAMINVIMSGDSQKGRQIAHNICQSYGISEQDALNQAKRYFNLPF